MCVKKIYQLEPVNLVENILVKGRNIWPIDLTSCFVSMILFSCFKNLLKSTDGEKLMVNLYKPKKRTDKTLAGQNIEFKRRNVQKEKKKKT